MEGWGEFFEDFFRFVAWVLVPLSILGIWKLIEILGWLIGRIANG